MMADRASVRPTVQPSTAFRVFKYHIYDPENTIIRLPCRTVFLAAGTQIDSEGDPRIVIWMLVDQFEQLFDKRKFIAVNTGDPLPEGKLLYLDTVTTPNGIVWHILEDVGASTPVEDNRD